jgi:hypothetical protein
MPDCDDNDPERSQNLYTDADSDGFGSPDSPTCVAPLALDAPAPPGLSLNQADCDDTAADVHPGAFERWDDGVDSNCDGNDDPLACGEAGRSCGCDLLATSTVPIVTSCTGSDLFIAAQETCTTCLGRDRRGHRQSRDRGAQTASRSRSTGKPFRAWVRWHPEA